MFKRLVVLLLALLISVAVIACTKKTDTEVSSSESPSSFVDKGVVESEYNDDLTSSELEELESEMMTDSNVDIVTPNNSSNTDSTDSTDSGSSGTTSSDNAPTSSSDITGFY